jgi:hypothetical protein
VGTAGCGIYTGRLNLLARLWKRKRKMRFYEIPVEVLVPSLDSAGMRSLDR